MHWIQLRSMNSGGQNKHSSRVRGSLLKVHISRSLSLSVVVFISHLCLPPSRCSPAFSPSFSFFITITYFNHFVRSTLTNFTRILSSQFTLPLLMSGFLTFRPPEFSPVPPPTSRIYSDSPFLCPLCYTVILLSLVTVLSVIHDLHFAHLWLTSLLSLVHTDR